MQHYQVLRQNRVCWGPFLPLFNTHTVTDTRLQHQDHHHPIAIMTDLEDIATEDLAIAESSVAISSAHHQVDDEHHEHGDEYDDEYNYEYDDAHSGDF